MQALVARQSSPGSTAAPPAVSPPGARPAGATPTQQRGATPSLARPGPPGVTPSGSRAAGATPSAARAPAAVRALRLVAGGFVVPHEDKVGA